MDQLLIVGRKRLARELLANLQELGVVQLEPIHLNGEGADLVQRLKPSEEELQAKSVWEAVMAKCDGLLDSLAVPPPAEEVPASQEFSAPEGAQAYLDEVSRQVDARLRERGDLSDELELIRTYLAPFRELAPYLAPFKASRYLHAKAFLVPGPELLERTETTLQESLEDRFELALIPFGKSQLAVAVVLEGDRGELDGVLSRLGLSELALPERYREHGMEQAVEIMEERAESHPQRLAQIAQELSELAAEHGEKLLRVRQLAVNHHARLSALEELGEGRYSFALRGWVPRRDRPKVVESLRREFNHDVLLEARPADEHHDKEIPVKLENPAWVKPFEGLLALFAPPKYGYFDPSFTLAVFFPLFFGLVVGDIGFGLLFWMIGAWLRKRGRNGQALGLGPLGITLTPRALPSIGSVINWCAVWSIAFGIIYGEFFGNFLERWHGFFGKPLFYSTIEHAPGYGWIDIPLFRVENFMPLLLLTIGFGVLQVLGGWLIRIYYGIKHGDATHMWEGIGMFSGLSAVVIFAYAFLTNNLNALTGIIVVSGFAIFFYAVIASKMVLMIVELISNSGNILSYLRLFAVGLSAALVANLATDLGFAISGSLPVIGPLLGIVVGLSVHLLAMALTIIGHTLQPLRLQYVEFFTKFGFYEQSGYPYRPFRLFGGKV